MRSKLRLWVGGIAPLLTFLASPALAAEPAEKASDDVPAAEPAAAEPASPEPAPAAATAAPAPASEENLPGRLTSFDVEYRTRGVGVGEYPLDATGTTLDQSGYAEHRLRFGAVAKNGPITMTAEADLANGLLLGETSTSFPYVGYRRDRLGGLADPASIYVRQLWLDARTPYGVVRAGHMLSKWGLGLVAHDGAGSPVWGDYYLGDTVERALFATRPLAKSSPRLAPLLVAIGGDVVFRDQSADLRRGDRAYQGVLSAVWAPEGSPTRAGVYAVRRTQVDRDGFHLDVWVLDAHLKAQKEMKWATVRFEAEFARIFGETNAVRDIYDGSRVIDQYGNAFELGVDFGEARRVGLLLQGGGATGDDRSLDGRITSFKFDPEYNVGFILFEEVMAWQSAATARKVADPDTFGRAAPGARFLPTEGAVTNAHYLMPTIRYNPVKPVEVKLGVLLAQAVRPLDDAFQTNALHGGVRHTTLGSTTDSLDLGTEIDIGARYTWERRRGMDLSADLQLGRFLPGGAFVDAEGEKMAPVDRVFAGMTLSW